MLLVSRHVLAATTLLNGQTLLPKVREWEKFSRDEKAGDPVVNDHPADLDKPAAESVLKALRQAYPCPSPRPAGKAAPGH